MKVDVSANLSILFPSVVPKVTVIQTGVAKLRALTQLTIIDTLRLEIISVNQSQFF